jgi:wobble nucleotide-excising tRNase
MQDQLFSNQFNAFTIPEFHVINRINLIRNIGKFDSSAPAAQLTLAQLALGYAENGRGKTTLTAILRSLAKGDPIPIVERRRLAALNPPHVIIECDGGPPPAIFHNGGWNRSLPNMEIFDDIFVAENVCSGLEVNPDHRQHLHELVLGAQGVALNNQLNQLVAQVEAHSVSLRNKAAAIPTQARGPYTVEEFIALQARADIDDAILAAERTLRAARQHAIVTNAPSFEAIALPAIDLTDIERLLHMDLQALNAGAANLVQAHIAKIGQDGERWVAEGIKRIPPGRNEGANSSGELCPFCAQDLSGSDLINHYRNYFGNEYSKLRGSISDNLEHFERSHSGMAVAAFERSVRVGVERQQFWSPFCDVPDASVDTVAVAVAWRQATEPIAALLRTKRDAPLDRIDVPEDVKAAVSAYEEKRSEIATLNQRFQEANAQIQIVKQQAIASNQAALVSDVARLQAIKSRYTPAIEPLCQDYINEKAAKTLTEQQRDQTRDALDRHRTNVFPGYEAAINIYLLRFNAGFRLARMTSANTRAGSTCNYNVVINGTSVPVTGGAPPVGEAAFRNTLSAGDRNTLALAFFFASLDQDPNLANKVVVIDDPVSSLDDHRSLTTVQEIRRLSQRVGQVIVLSHSKQFLCNIWTGANPATRSAMQVVRDGNGSNIEAWNVDQDSITEHDRRHSLLRVYLRTGAGNSREVAAAIRPVLEAFLRVACPEHFIPGTLLGPFRNLCIQRLGTPQQILDAASSQELNDLTEYANRFHHDTNPAWQTEIINDVELEGFVRRALDFAKR